MNIKYRKCIVWFMLSLYLMLSPLPLWNNADMVLCLGLEDACDDCHDGLAFVPQGDHCQPAENACRKSFGYDSPRDACFCCVDFPISSYIEENIPSPRPHNSSGGHKNVLAPSLPDAHPLLNKTLFPSSPDLHLISTQKTLRSVILII